MKKYLVLFGLLLAGGRGAVAQGFDVKYRFRESGSAFQDKAFYFLTLLEDVPGVQEMMMHDSVLNRLFVAARGRLRELPAVCGDSVGCYLRAWQWTDADNAVIRRELVSLADRPAIHRLLGEVRACGNFIRCDSLGDATCLERLWQDAADGMNYCLEAYLTNKGMLYPAIDSTHYPAASHYYGDLVHELMLMVARRAAEMRLWFEPAMEIAGETLAINGRDEATRHDVRRPDVATAALVSSISWPKYPYAAIVVFGEGPEDGTVPLSPHGKYRCELAARLYRQGRAPLIVVSGGHVHPFETPYAEGLEMRRWLIDHWHIPAAAILTDPVARHTTTNFRNSERLLLRYGVPLRKLLGISGISPLGYICGPRLPERSIRDLGYVPYRDVKRLDEFTFSFYPIEDCLQVNALDPLDP